MPIVPPRNSQTAAPAETGFHSGDDLDLQRRWQRRYPEKTLTAAPAATGFDSGDDLDLPVAQFSPHYDSDDFDLPAAQPSPRHAGMLDKFPAGSSAAVGGVYVGKIVPAFGKDE